MGSEWVRNYSALFSTIQHYSEIVTAAGYLCRNTPEILPVGLADFCQETYQLAGLFVGLRRCANSCMVRLCAHCHALKTNPKSCSIWYVLFRQWPDTRDPCHANNTSSTDILRPDGGLYRGPAGHRCGLDYRKPTGR